MSKKIGRTSSYKPQYCEMLIENFKKGKSYVAFASLCGVSRDTLYEWEKVHKEFLDAKKIGWQHYQAWWEEQGQEGMYDQTFVEGDGSRRSVKLNSAVWIYNMKCRFREDWHESHKIDAAITQPNSQDEQEVKELIHWYKSLKEMK